MGIETLHTGLTHTPSIAWTCRGRIHFLLNQRLELTHCYYFITVFKIQMKHLVSCGLIPYADVFPFETLPNRLTQQPIALVLHQI